MRISVQHPHRDISYYVAVQDGPLRKIFAEGSSYSEVFVAVLTQIAEQGKEIAEGKE
jgi:hypothetical protein